MKTKYVSHTPGPWSVRDYKNKSDGIWVDCNAFSNRGKKRCLGGTICDVLPTGDSTQAANASLIAAAPDLLEACKKALFDSSLDNSETVLSAEVHEALNNAIVAAEGHIPVGADKKRVPSPPLGPRSWCFGQGPAESENGYWDDACDNCECIDKCSAIAGK